MQRVKNGHYVSQFLLNQFRFNAKGIFAFDKVTRRVFPTSPRIIASEQAFYDIPPGHGVAFQAVEKAFCAIEDKAAGVVRTLLEEVDQNRRFDPWNPDRRATLAFFLVLQECRTRAFRSNYCDLSQQLGERLRRKHDLARRFLEERGHQVVEQPINIQIPEELASVEHTDFMFRPEYLNEATSALIKHVWIVGKNTTTQPLFISDDPVIRHSHAPHPVFGGAGLASPGIQIALPLSPRHILILIERTFFQRCQEREGMILLLQPSHIDFYNSRQIVNSFRQIYCSEDSFDQVRDYEKEHPDVFEINRSRFEIG